ncbi:MAG: response regulator [Verrucomicrobiales bacterium]
MTSAASMLLVEDNEDDVFLMERALNLAGIINPVHLADDGLKAIQYLSGAGKYQDRTSFPLPKLVFLDLKLPIKSGHSVLSWIRSEETLNGLVVVVLTSSNEPKDIKESYRLGANSYMVKPPTPEQLTELAASFRWEWLVIRRDSPAG